MTDKPMQDNLFHEDINDALGTLCLAMGGYKKVAGMLWPHMTLNSAYARLKNCLREDKQEKLSPEELLFLIKAGHEVGCHAVINFICIDSHYEQPKALKPQDESDALMKQYIEAAKTLKIISERIERVQVMAVSGE